MDLDKIKLTNKAIDPHTILGEYAQFRGKIERIMFPRTKVNDGDFAIFSFHCYIEDGDVPDEFPPLYGGSYLITFKGTVPALDPAEEYVVIGKLVEDDKYGFQYEVVQMRTDYKLDSIEAQKRFLSWILPEKTMEALFEKFSNPVELLEQKNVRALTQVKGIGASTAMRLISRYENNKDNSAAYVELYDYGLTKNMIDKLIKQFGSPDVVVRKVRDNPYILIDEADGIGWVKADTLALNKGMDPESEARIGAYIKYLLRKLANDEGHTWVAVDFLFDKMFEIVPNIEPSKLQSYFSGFMKNGLLYYTGNEDRRVGLKYYRDLEETIGETLTLIKYGSMPNYEGVEESILEAEKETGFEYTEEQRRAIKAILSNKITLITGLAGTGKSSIMLPVVKVLKANHKTFAQCALSGKAGLNLTFVTGEEGMTIHRMLGYNPMTDSFNFNKDHKMPYDMIILDELSMVGGELFLKMLEAMPETCSLVMLGDPGQLEAIGLCNLIRDIENAGTIPHVHLNKIHRQAARSGIILDSLNIYNSNQIIPSDFVGTQIRGELQDFEIESAENAASCAVKGLAKIAEYFRLGITVDDMVVVVAKRSAGDASARAMNESIHELVNPIATSYDVTVRYKDGTTLYDVVYRPRDRVLVTQNIRDVRTEDGKDCPIYNGNLGTIEWISPESGYMGVRFSQGTVVIPQKLWKYLQHGYAITCHRLQGSGVPFVVVLADPSAAYSILSKEWLYTAITRAKKYCTLIGPTKTIRQATVTTRVRAKQTWLTEILVERDLNYKEKFCL